jgi:ABC-type nitrate/sulfonate/bicarbonate transport system substrate-binding protein
MKKFIALMLTLSALTAALTGCKASNTAKTQPQKLQKVTVVLDWTPNTNHTGIYVAKARGFYKKEGLDVDIEQPPEDGALSLLASGKAQFAVSFQEEIATAITADKPLDVVAVAALIQHNDSGIVSLKEKGITSPKFMEGMRYATWDSPTEKAILKDVITKDGGNFSKVKMISTDVENIVAALKTNIDCVWGYYPQEGITCEAKGLQTNYFYFKDLDPALDFYTPVLASSTTYLKSNPETAKKFLKATAKGYEFAISEPDASANILMKSVKGLDREIVLKGQRWLKSWYKAEVTQWGYIDPKRWNRFYAWLYQNKAITKKIAVGAGFTDKYLDKE